MGQEDEENNQNYNMKASGSTSTNYYHDDHGDQLVLDHNQPKQNHNNMQAVYGYGFHHGSMHLPQLFSPERAAATPFLNTMDLECSQNLLRLTSNPNCATGLHVQQDHHHQRFNGSDWSFLDKLLASHSNSTTSQLDHQQAKCNPITSTHVADHVGTSSSSQLTRFPFQYLGCETADILKFSNK